MIDKKAIPLTLVLTCAAASPGLSQARSAESLQCATVVAPPSPLPLDQVGGIHITAKGTLRILLVFASFPDDETYHPYWPAHQPPASMEQFIDPDTLTRSQNLWNLTNYFRQMSLGQFQVVGEAVWVETLHSWTQYTNGSYGRANWSVLQERVDPIVDFSKYDNWTNSGDFQNTNAPDSVVDMIVMVWRTTVFGMLGEASLGYKPGFVVDGKRIEMGFPERYDAPLGSGVTCEYPYSDDPPHVMKTMAHEIGHWLLGGPHPYNGQTNSGKHQYWGLLCASQRVSSCANSYERERLGWIAVPEIPRNANVTVGDFVTTGEAYKFHPREGGLLEEFYFENHQQISAFDDVTVNAGDRGLWILHQLAPYCEMDFLKIKPADGNWQWENPGTSTACFGEALPAFSRGSPEVGSGESHRDQLTTKSSAVNWMLVYGNSPGQTSCGSFFAGQDFDGAFRASGNNVFSRCSNPNSNTWDNQSTDFSLEVLSDSSGVLILRSPSNPLECPPARRHLGIAPGTTEYGSGSLPLAWGAEWPDGQPLESDVVWSELQRRIGDGGTWIGAFAGAATTWRDSSMAYDTSGSVPVYFRARVRDSGGMYSNWSSSFVTHALLVGVRDDPASGKVGPGGFCLVGNYPNPFNPKTVVSYQLSVASHVRLGVYDLLGHEVAVLVNEKKPAGNYEVTFDAGGLASGTYLYRMTAGQFTQTRTMVFLK